MAGADASRRYIEAAAPDHPSLLDPTHEMDALFGVVNIPNVIWIDEQGRIVRPAEPGWPGPPPAGALERLRSALPALSRAANAPAARAGGVAKAIASGQDRESYPAKIRHWAEHGGASPYVLSADEVVARSQPRGYAASEAAAHFEFAVRLWTTGRRELAIDHFNDAHRLQPDNWTYKRQAYSAVGYERHGGDVGRFVQAPLPGEEEEWPFSSDFYSEVRTLEPGQYYPNTMD